MHTVAIGNHTLELSESHIRYGGYEIPLDQVRGLNIVWSNEAVGRSVWWGAMANPVLAIPLFAALAGPSSRRASIAPTRFIGVHGDSQSLRINCAWAFADLEELDTFFESVFNSIWQAVGKQLTAQLISDLEQGLSVTIGDISICRDGAWLYGRRSILSLMDKPALVPWTDIKIEGDLTELRIQSIRDTSRRGVLMFNNVENATVLDAAIRHLLQDDNWKKLGGPAAELQSLN